MIRPDRETRTEMGLMIERGPDNQLFVLRLAVKYSSSRLEAAKSDKDVDDGEAKGKGLDLREELVEIVFGSLREEEDICEKRRSEKCWASRAKKNLIQRIK